MTALKGILVPGGLSIALALVWIGVTHAVGWTDYPMWLAVVVGAACLVVGQVVGRLVIRAEGRGRNG